MLSENLISEEWLCAVLCVCEAWLRKLILQATVLLLRPHGVYLHPALFSTFSFPVFPHELIP
jgi:hypothetical protein